MNILEIERPSIILLVFGIILSLIGISVIFNPQEDTVNMIFLSLFGIGLFIFGLSLSLLNQIRKVKKTLI
ncbi:MAG: hypothetical protein ITD33_06820 [Nitrosarchaeum sp.]|jgi:hypothetical protein|nr:hypothetical protein [Nitrosarchaeum sp.]MBP0120549.1 hypothetical protein [Nitrosarchaeum sp.]MBP0133484.1 hypothetical protein [Nitrosarchaeum sp.]